MKKLILFAAILFAGMSFANAQSQNVKREIAETPHKTITKGVSTTSSTKLHVTLNPILSISVNTSDINLQYTTVEDYQKGVRTGFIGNHLNVYSTGGFDVAVKYENPSSEDGPMGETNDLFKSIQLVTVDKDAAQQSAKFLTRNDQSIIKSNIGAMNLMYNIDYRGKGIEEYVNYIKKGEKRIFTAEVVYTITAK